MAPHHRIAFLTKNGSNPAYEGARTGASRVAERMGGTVSHAFPSTPDDPRQQAELVAEALDGGAQAIVLAPAHPTALNDALARVRDAGIPLVYFVSCTEGLDPDCYVTADNYALARGIGARLLAHLGGQGDLAVLEGSPHSVTSAPRTQGFLDAVAAQPGARIVARRTAHYLRAPGQAAMAEILRTVPHLDGVLAANDDMAIGALAALEAAGRTAAVASVNAMPEAIAALKAGRLVATAAYDAMTMGCIATEAAFRLLRGQTVPPSIELPVEIIHAENCAAYERPFAERTLPDWAAAVGGA